MSYKLRQVNKTHTSFLMGWLLWQQADKREWITEATAGVTVQWVTGEKLGGGGLSVDLSNIFACNMRLMRACHHYKGLQVFCPDECPGSYFHQRDQSVLLYTEVALLEITVLHTLVFAFLATTGVNSLQVLLLEGLTRGHKLKHRTHSHNSDVCRAQVPN